MPLDKQQSLWWKRYPKTENRYPREPGPNDIPAPHLSVGTLVRLRGKPDKARAILKVEWHRYLLCSHDGYWAVCSSVASAPFPNIVSINLQFVDCVEIAEKLKAFYGINVLSKAELDADFQLLPDLPYMSESDLKCWKPQTMGEALFNWWD
jgi:hypothetical protein